MLSHWIVRYLFHKIKKYINTKCYTISLISPISLIQIHKQELRTVHFAINSWMCSVNSSTKLAFEFSSLVPDRLQLTDNEEDERVGKVLIQRQLDHISAELQEASGL